MPPLVAAEPAEALGIVAVERVIEPQRRFPRIEREHPVEPVIELRGRYPILCEPVRGGVPEEIVHRAVEPVGGEQPVRVRPRFAEQERFRVFLFDRVGEMLPELRGRFVRHIQPPAVDVKVAYPVLADRDEIIPRSGVRQIDLRHPFVVADAVVIFQLFVHREALREKPGGIAGAFAVSHHILKRRPVVPAVVEYAVEQHPQPELVGRADKLREIVLRAEGGVDVEIIHGVVLVVGRSFEYGREIQARCAEIADVPELFDDTAKIAALEIFPRRRRAPALRAGRIV